MDTTETQWTPDELVEIQKQLSEQQRNEVFELRKYAMHPNNQQEPSAP